MKYTIYPGPANADEDFVIVLNGELDHHSAANLREGIDKDIEKYGFGKWAIDLSGVQFMDSSGLGVILGRYRYITDRGGSLSLHNPTKAVDRLLKMSGIYSIVEVSNKQKEQEQ